MDQQFNSYMSGNFSIVSSNTLEKKLLNVLPESPSASCDKPLVIKRPMNAFMLWARLRRREIAAEFPNMHNSEISKRLGEEWHALREEEKAVFKKEAEDKRKQHLLDYPDYKFKPRKKSTKKLKVIAVSKLTNMMELPNMMDPPDMMEPPQTNSIVPSRPIPQYADNSGALPPIESFNSICASPTYLGLYNSPATVNYPHHLTQQYYPNHQIPNTLYPGGYPFQGHSQQTFQNQNQPTSSSESSSYSESYSPSSLGSSSSPSSSSGMEAQYVHQTYFPLIPEEMAFNYDSLQNSAYYQ